MNIYHSRILERRHCKENYTSIIMPTVDNISILKGIQGGVHKNLNYFEYSFKRQI